MKTCTHRLHAATIIHQVAHSVLKAWGKESWVDGNKALTQVGWFIKDFPVTDGVSIISPCISRKGQSIFLQTKAFSDSNPKSIIYYLQPIFLGCVDNTCLKGSHI